MDWVQPCRSTRRAIFHGHSILSLTLCRKKTMKTTMKIYAAQLRMIKPQWILLLNGNEVGESRSARKCRGRPGNKASLGISFRSGSNSSSSSNDCGEMFRRILRVFYREQVFTCSAKKLYQNSRFGIINYNWPFFSCWTNMFLCVMVKRRCSLVHLRNFFKKVCHGSDGMCWRPSSGWYSSHDASRAVNRRRDWLSCGLALRYLF